MSGTEELYKLFLDAGKISTDSRQVKKGSIFFALKGENFDGNKYAREALSKGASLSVVDDKSVTGGPGFFLVDDVLTCLQDLARLHISTLKIPVIGLTGTNGKTTTKELIRQVLSVKYRVHATTGNLNNHIGVPLTIMGIGKDAELAVVEMGANHIGEIALLCSIAQPTHGLITNIGKAHLEGFGSLEGVIRAKTELYEYLRKNDGKVFVNRDDELLMKLSEGLKRSTYGMKDRAGTGGSISGSVPFLNIGYKGINIETHLYGDYNFWNIMAALSIGEHFDVSTEEMKEVISSYMPSNNRSQVIRKGNNTIFMDAYNANPSSMHAAISQFMKQEAGNKVLILGDMLELGESSREEHLKIISDVQQPGIRVILVGPEFMAAGSATIETIFNDTDEAGNWLSANPIQEAHILFKGSRGIALEKLLDYL